MSKSADAVRKFKCHEVFFSGFHWKLPQMQDSKKETVLFSRFTHKQNIIYGESKPNDVECVLFLGEMNRRHPSRQPLTQLVLQVTVLVVLHVFVLAEEVLVHVPPAEQPHVRVVRDGPVSLVGAVEGRALGFGLHRRHHERDAEQPQQLLV